MNNRGQIMDILEFKIGIIILLILIVLALILFYLPKPAEFLFGKSNFYEKDLSTNIVSVQKSSLYNLAVLNQLNTETSIGSLKDSVLLGDQDVIYQDLTDLQYYNFQIEYSDGAKLSVLPIDEQLIYLDSGVLLLDMQQQLVFVRFVGGF